MRFDSLGSSAKRTGLLTVVLSSLYISTLPGRTTAGQLDIRVGTGYEFLSQEFFLDSAALAGEDSLLTNWSLTNTYLDDFKVKLMLAYIPDEERLSQFTATYEQSADFIRSRINADFKTAAYGQRLTLEGELEGKARYRGDVEVGDEYLQGFGRARLYQPINGNLTLRMDLKADGVKFDQPATYIYNYWRVGGSIGLEKSFESFSFADVNLFIQSRLVPDSTDLAYLNLGLEGAYYGFYNGGDLYLLARLEHKNYNQPDHKDDHYRIGLDGRNKTGLGQGWFTSQQVNLELVMYNPDDPVNYDYTRLETRLGLGLEHRGLTVSLGPELERLAEEKTDMVSGEDYWEYGGGVEIDLLSRETLISADAFWGLRNNNQTYELENDLSIQTDFTYQRLSLLGDVNFARHWNFNILFSGEWEWHDQEEENSRLFLLSTGFTYQF
ncbi:MAG TPA: hypothetical protein PLF13_13785 [candidate division Zixibacteria bacterium]|nr:hypothetical protein [candidate division Zixibacteria bacterium]